MLSLLFSLLRSFSHPFPDVVDRVFGEFCHPTPLFQVQVMMEISHAPLPSDDSTLTWLQVWALMTFLSGVGVQLYLCWIPIRLCARCCDQHPMQAPIEVPRPQPVLDTRSQQGRQWVWGRNNVHLRLQPTGEESEPLASRFPQEALVMAKLLRRRRF